MEIFEYNQEVFHDNVLLLADISKFVPQKSLLEDSILAIKSDNSILQNIPNILRTMNIILCFIKRMKMLSISNLPLVEFTKQFLPNEIYNAIITYDKIATISLSYIISLYELLEDLVDDSVLKCVHDSCRASLPTEENKQIATLVDNAAVKLQSLTKVIRRFMIRYCCSEELPPSWNSDWGLNDLLEERLLQNVFTAEPFPIFPNSLQLCHIYETFQLLTSLIGVTFVSLWLF